MKGYILTALLVVFLLYMIIWTVKLNSHTRRQKKVKRVQELRAKGNEIKKRTIDCTKDYWYNQREIEDCKEGEDFEKYYHYFIGVDEGVKELLLEMYDCGIVRTDELEEIAYGKNHLRNVDLSFLEELEREMKENEPETASVQDSAAESKSSTREKEADKKEEKDAKIDAELSDVIQVEGIMGDFFSSHSKVVDAAKHLEKDDPGITDIHGTLSSGIVDVIAAVDAEEEEEQKKNEPIMVKSERSVEEDRKSREKTSTSEIRNKIYEKWVGYVFELYELVNINANEDTKHKIRKALMDYGYNDVDVLLEGPDYYNYM